MVKLLSDLPRYNQRGTYSLHDVACLLSTVLWSHANHLAINQGFTTKDPYCLRNHRLVLLMSYTKITVRERTAWFSHC